MCMEYTCKNTVPIESINWGKNVNSTQILECECTSVRTTDVVASVCSIESLPNWSKPYLGAELFQHEGYFQGNWQLPVHSSDELTFERAVFSYPDLPDNSQKAKELVQLLNEK